MALSLFFTKEVNKKIETISNYLRTELYHMIINRRKNMRFFIFEVFLLLIIVL